MSAKRLYLLMLLLLIGCQQAGVGADTPAQPVNTVTVEAEPDTKLQLYKEALTNKGSSEQMRINAANLLLFSKDPLAREIVLAVLKESANRAACAAVCRTLSKAWAERKSVEKSEDFIAPLLEILRTEQEFAIAKLAAEATLIFDYDQISEPLENIATDSSLQLRARLNAIYALKLQPDKRAVIRLIELVDDPERQVAAASERTLKSLSIPIGKDRETRRQIISEIEVKDNEAFLRERLIRTGDVMRKLEAERNLWQKQYLDALNMIYVGKDDSAKGKFLAEHLSSPEAAVKLWVLEKVYEWRVGTRTKSELPAEVGSILLNLISDRAVAIRLKTARLLALMDKLNSAEKLLAQLKLEQADDVRTELFVALGSACYYALSPESVFKIAPEIRKETLKLAQEYLSSEEPKKAQAGAEVIKKLLERDGLETAEVDRYLGLFVQRYSLEKGNADGSLRGELVGAMARLCGQSVYKSQAAKVFKPVFEEALGDKHNLVREAAVDGLIYIDKTAALKRLRNGFVNDSSPRVREKLIGLAGEVGGRDDLVWLWKKIGSTAESEPAWEAMLKIFRRSEAAVLAGWMGEFNSPTSDKLSVEHKLSVLKIAEQKAIGASNGKMLKATRENLAELYKKSGEFEKAAKYLGMLYGAAPPPEDKESILPDLLDAYLRWPNPEMAAKLIDNCLLGSDLGPNSAVVLSIDSYLSDPPEGVDPNEVLEKLLVKTKPTEDKPKWQEQLKRWRERLEVAKKLDGEEEADN